MYKVSINTAFKISLKSYEKKRRRRHSTDQARDGGINAASYVRQKTDQTIVMTVRPLQYHFLNKLHLALATLHMAFSGRSVVTMDRFNIWVISQKLLV